jgi:hypothetical protein
MWNLESFSLSFLLLLLYYYYHFINILSFLILFLYSTSSLEKIMWKCESAAASAQEVGGRREGGGQSDFQRSCVCVCVCVCVCGVCVSVCGVVCVCVCVRARACEDYTERRRYTRSLFPPFLSLKPHLFGPPMVSFAIFTSLNRDLLIN